MPYAQRIEIDVTTDGSGNASVSSQPVSGRIQTVVYVKDGTNPFSNGVTVALTAEQTGETIWSQASVNASAVVAPRQPTHTTAGAAALYAAAGQAVNDNIVLANDCLVLAISSGGANKVGKFFVVLV